MINLSAFGYEQDMRIQDIIPETWRRKDFIQGQMVKQFEQDFAKYVKAKHCVAVGACTSALQMSLLALGIGAEGLENKNTNSQSSGSISLIHLYLLYSA